MSEKIKVGDIVETCSLMPGVVMEINKIPGLDFEYYDDLVVRMLDRDSSPNNHDAVFMHCSLHNCGIVKLTAKQALDRLIVGKEELSKLWKMGSGEDYSVYEARIQQKVLDKN